MTAPRPPINRRAIPAGFRFGGWTAPDGWAHRSFDWPVAGRPRGSLLFASGRADFVEKYLEALDHWHRRGWAIAGFDWRGQGGSGRVVPGLAAGHLASFDPLVEDLAGFAAAWRAATPRPHVAVGHSMGGHLLLRALAERRVTVDAAVLSAPMLGINAPRIARVLPFLAGLFGATMRPIARELDAGARQRRLTGSVERFEDAAWWRERQPELALGSPSWGWVHAAYDSIARLRRPGMLEGVTTPLLVLKAQDDRLVSGVAIERAVRRLPNVRVERSAGAHELLREADAVRLPLLAAIDAFLDDVAPTQ